MHPVTRVYLMEIAIEAMKRASDRMHARLFFIAGAALLGCAPVATEWCLVPAPNAAPYCYARRADCEQEVIDTDVELSGCFERAVGDAGL